MNLEEYTNNSERSLNCWIRWMHPLMKLSIVHVMYAITKCAHMRFTESSRNRCFLFFLHKSTIILLESFCNTVF